MRQTHLPSTSPRTADSIPAESLMQYAEDWFLDCEIRQLSPNTLANRKIYLEKLDWFLKKNNLSQCGG